MQSIIDEGFRLAQAAGTAPDASPVIDNQFALEDMFRTALTEAIIQHKWKRSFSLTIVNGSATLPDLLLPEWEGINVSGDTPTSFEKNYSDYQAASLDFINYATIRNNSFEYREAGADVGEYDGALEITAVGLPTIGAITDTIDIPATLADATSQILARMLRGN